MKHNTWNNPMESKQKNIFQILRESANQKPEVKSPFKEGSSYTFTEEDFLLVADRTTNEAVVPTDEGLANGAYSDYHMVNAGDVFRCTGISETSVTFQLGEGEEVIEFTLPSGSPILNKVAEKVIVGEAGKVKSEVGSIGGDPLNGPGKGGENASGDALVGSHGDGSVNAETATKGKDPMDANAISGKGTEGEMKPDLISGSKEGGKDASGDELSGSKGGKSVNPATGTLKGDALTAKKEGAEPDKDGKEDPEEDDKKDDKDVEKDADKADDKDDEKDEKDVKEGTATDPAEKDEKDKKDADEDKDEKEKKDKDMKEAKEDDEKGDPEADKKAEKGEKDDDDENAKEEDEEVDEATSLLLQKIGSAVVRTLIDEMAKGTGKGLFKNEGFIMEVARRVARIEREGVSSTMPKKLESTLAYPAVEESMDFTDLVVFETNEGTYVVDRFKNDTVYKADSSVVEAIIKEGVTAHAKSLTKVEETVIFAVGEKGFTFNK